jgi:hypothetical protein
MLINPNDFWSWAYSDFLSNANRGILAEFIVHTAIQSKTIQRREWNACDLVTADGLKIEVKCSAYLQSWKQEKPSKLIFDIAPKKAWHAETNTYDDVANRHADIYIFCVFKTKDKEKANPLNSEEWEFIVLPTNELNRKYQEQKSISYHTLIKIGSKPIKYEELLEIIVNTPLHPI